MQHPALLRYLSQSFGVRFRLTKVEFSATFHDPSQDSANDACDTDTSSTQCLESPGLTRNKPKEYPSSNDMMGRFLRTGFVWVRHVNNSRNFHPRRRMGDKCKAQLAEPSTEPFLKQQPFAQKKEGDCETNVKNCLGKPFGKRKPFAAKNPRRPTCHFAPRPLLSLKTPKPTLLGKNAKKSCGTGRQV